MGYKNGCKHAEKQKYSLQPNQTMTYLPLKDFLDSQSQFKN